jgi:tRNA-splicing ligase RtcB
MAKTKITGHDLLELGIPSGEQLGLVLKHVNTFIKGKKDNILEKVRSFYFDKEAYCNDPLWKPLYNSLNALELKINANKEKPLRTHHQPFQIWGKEGIDESAIHQLIQSTKLEPAVQGALLPDGHYGYGLPVGGVLACDNAVIPYGVGVDIGCRMSISIFDLPSSYLNGMKDKLKKGLQRSTFFGIGSKNDKQIHDDIFDRPEFNNIKILKQLKNTAANIRL